ncbi:hypothetical protein N9E50_00830 [Alphaproteobacteria bacterium]|nr:hypothetical protein [Alphaproteobacteria bacterium]
MKIYIKFFLLIFLLSPKIFADESLLKNYNKLKILLNNETITIEQFNSGIDNIIISSVDYQNVKELFKDNVISKEDYLKILDSLITKAQPSPQNYTITDDKKTLTDTREIEISLKIFQVGLRVPTSLNAKVNSIEKLILKIEQNKVNEIIMDESNKFFNKEKVKSFKNIKINLKNEKILKGKSRLVMKEFQDANLIMWWNIDLSSEKPVGKIEIEIPGKGPQIKLITNN